MAFRYRFKKEDLEHEKKENIRDMAFPFYAL